MTHGLSANKPNHPHWFDRGDLAAIGDQSIGPAIETGIETAIETSPSNFVEEMILIKG